jgi:hypothetical protein
MRNMNDAAIEGGKNWIRDGRSFVLRPDASISMAPSVCSVLVQCVVRDREGHAILRSCKHILYCTYSTESCMRLAGGNRSMTGRYFVRRPWLSHFRPSSRQPTAPPRARAMLVTVPAGGPVHDGRKRYGVRMRWGGGAVPALIHPCAHPSSRYRYREIPPHRDPKRTGPHRMKMLDRPGRFRRRGPIPTSMPLVMPPRHSPMKRSTSDELATSD